MSGQRRPSKNWREEFIASILGGKSKEELAEIRRESEESLRRGREEWERGLDGEVTLRVVAGHRSDA